MAVPPLAAAVFGQIISRIGKVQVPDYDHTLPLRTEKIDAGTIRLTCLLLLTTCSNFLTYLPTLTLFTDTPTSEATVFSTY